MDSEEEWKLHSCYVIIEEAVFTAKIKELIDQTIWEEVKEFLDYELSKYPRITTLEVPGIQDAYGLRLRTIPEIIIWYAIDDDRKQVKLLEATAFDPWEFPEGN